MLNVNNQNDVAEIYNLYPRKVGKNAALKAINNALDRLRKGEGGEPMGRATATAFLIERTKIFAESEAGNKGVYTPYPASFYNAARYLDDKSEWGIKTRNEKCSKHPDSGRTPKGNCWDCYAESVESAGGSRSPS